MEGATAGHFDRLPVGVLSVDLGGHIREANACLAAWVGMALPDLVGMHVDRLLTRGGRVLYHTYLLPTLRQHGQVQELSLALDAHGESIHVLTCASLHQEAGEPVVQLVLSPMRERLRVEAELQRVQRAADSAPVMLFQYEISSDGKGRFAYASAGLRTLYRLSAEAVQDTDLPVWACVHPDDMPALMQARRRSAENGEQWVARYRARCAGQADWAWHALGAQPHKMPDGRVAWHGTVSDVTRQREMEQAERERDAAAQASRAKSEFLARMSHELRTPLNGIIGFAQLLAADATAGLDAAQRRKLGLIEASGFQLLTLVNDVLDISRIEAGRLHLNLQPIPLLPRLEAALSTVEPMVRAQGLHVVLQCPAQLAVLADAARLDQVMGNLLSNAVKYNRPQGRIGITVTPAHDGTLVIAMEDTGQGLSEAQLHQLYQPFNRLGAEQSRTEGTGLGLVITRSLVDAMGGRLEVSSQVGRGTTFSVVLPQAEWTEPVAPATPARPVPASDATLTKRVLYAEDNPVNATLMQAIMEDLPGVDLQIEATAEAALRSAAAVAPSLLLLDMHLPDKDGRELLGLLRALPGLRDVPAVAVSADAMPEDIQSALALGFAAYWTKPIDVGRVQSEVLRMLEQGAAPG